MPESDNGSAQSADEMKERWRLRLNHHSPVPLWTQVARELRRCIVQWNLPVEHLLPSEEFLADQNGLSRDPVRQAYLAMEEAGLVSSGPGPGPESGYYVAEAVTMEYVQVLPGSKITAPAADPDMDPDMPPWLVVALKVEAPGLDPIWYDATRVTLIVS